MNAQLSDGTDGIVAKFAQWVKSLRAEFAAVDSPQAAVALEERIRAGGKSILLMLFQERLQCGVDRLQERLRPCPDCGARRRHRGVRPRRLESSLGAVVLQGIYWQCPECGSSIHSVDALAEDRLSGVLKEMVLMLGVCCSGFAKAQLLAEKLLLIEADDDTIRRYCEAEGQRVLSAPVPQTPAPEGGTLWGSCDGTMVNTREEQWREVKAARFSHEGGEFAMASLESAGEFLPRMAKLARALLPRRAGGLTFTSDCAEWITKGVAEHLPGWRHIADYWHACQHIHPPAEDLYGERDLMTQDWSAYFCGQLRCAGGSGVADDLRLSAMSYPDLQDQRVVLNLAKFFDKHAGRMDYPQYIRDGLPIDSGPMESLCKQLGLRMKGPGMRWSIKNVSAMAYLVARWAVDPKRPLARGLAA